MRSEEERLDRELAELGEKIRTLQEEKNLLKNDLTYLEKVIREELGLVKPGEMVYKLVPEKNSAATPKPSPQSKSKNPG